MAQNFEDAIYRSDFPLDGPHLISASAGTGKTYQLQNIYARLILEKGFRVPEILVMTFTNAATRELKERIIAVLKDLKRRCAVPPLPCAGKQEELRADRLIACAEEKSLDRKLLARRAELALLEFDNASISTIHGFCQRALARYAFETGFGFGAKIQDQQKKATLHRMGSDWWITASEEEKGGGSSAALLRDIGELSQKVDWRFTETESDPLLLQAKEIVDAYEKERKNRENMSYDDLLRALREALNGENGEALAGKLRKEYQAALVDEFQDTDPVQYDIFRKIFLDAGNHPLFLVGDPKQAIYSFRGGDIFTYRKAVADLPEECKYELTSNFRTSARLMDAVNALFLDLENDCTFGSPEIPCRTEIRAKGEHPLLLECGLPDPTPFHLIRTPKVYPVLVEEIVRTLHEYSLQDKTGKEKKLSPGDIAVLTTSHREAAKIGERLRERGIPAVLEKTGSIFSRGGLREMARDAASSLAKDFYALLDAVLQEGKREPLLRALPTPFFPVTPADLLTMEEETLARWTAKFRELNTLWHRSGFGVFLARLEEAGRTGETTFRDRLAAQDDGARNLSDFEAMTEASFAAMKEIGRRPENLLAWWQERLTKITAEEENFKREPDKSGDAVQVMTMHKAKGLQFPVVFVPIASPASHSPYSCHGDAGELYFLSQKTGDPRVEQESQEERMRVLYVALTRAEVKTVLVSPEKPSSVLKKLMGRAAAHGAGPADPASPILWKKIAAPEAQKEYLRQEPLPFTVPAETPRLFDLRPLKGSYSSLQAAESPETEEGKDRDREWNVFLTDVRDPAEQIHPVFQIRGGAAAGNCWHDILEKIPFDADDETLRQRTERSLREYGFSPGAALYPGGTVAEVTVDMVKRTLAFPLHAPDGTTFSLREIPWSRRTSEQEFEFSSSGAAADTAALAEIIRRHWKDQPEKQDFIAAMERWKRPVPHGFFTGFIDLLFQQGEFRYIVDWKSNSLREERRRRCAAGLTEGDPLGFDRQGITREMASHWYFFQYLFYSVVLHRILKQSLGCEYRWERHFGGIRYFFLRGIAAGTEEPVFSDRPAPELLDELASALGWEG